MNMWAVSTFWLLWLMLLWASCTSCVTYVLISLILFIFLGYLGVELLGHMKIPCVTFEGTGTVPHSSCVTLPPTMCKYSRSPHPHQHLLFLCLITAIIGGVKWCLIVLFFSSHCGSDWASFYVSVGYLCISLDKCLFRAFAHIKVVLLGSIVINETPDG